MHTISTKPKPAPPKTFAILTRDGREHTTRSSYWISLMVGYQELGIGNFTVEEKR